MEIFRSGVLILMMGGAMASDAFAQTAPGLTFRSVRSELADRPRGGLIDLFAQQGRATTAPGADVAAWFWAEHSPARNLSDAGRLQAAARTAASRGSYHAPADQLQSIMSEFANPIRDAATASNVSSALLAAVIYVESRGRRAASSPAGAVGLMQLMPGTASDLGVTDRTNPAQNVHGGARYLSQLLQAHDEDALLALAAYNAGPGAVRRAGGVPNYAETRAYVPRVLAAWQVARTLCAQEPETPRARCDFSTTGTFAD